MMQVIEGKGREYDRSAELVEAIMAAVYEKAQGMSVAAFVGCLEIAKLEIISEQGE
jgi:hypothetical protein